MNKAILRQVALKYPGEVMEPYDAILDLDGFDAICAFSDYLGGMTVYVPTLRTIFARCIELEASKEFNGANYRSLCQKYGFSDRHLRRFLRHV